MMGRCDSLGTHDGALCPAVRSPRPVAPPGHSHTSACVPMAWWPALALPASVWPQAVRSRVSPRGGGRTPTLPLPCATPRQGERKYVHPRRLPPWARRRSGSRVRQAIPRHSSRLSWARGYITQPPPGHGHLLLVLPPARLPPGLAPCCPTSHRSDEGANRAPRPLPVTTSGVPRDPWRGLCW